MRIISGTLRGRKLHAISGIAIRPTSDMVRESIFNILFSQVLDAVVLDLFAGTGAFGIEALSRGAESSVFIDNSKNAISVIKKNILTCRIEDRSKILLWNIVNNLNCLKSSSPLFNLVFMDPPYNKNLIIPALHNLHLSQSLENGACIVLEHSDFEPIPENISGFKITDHRKYGNTLVSFLEYCSPKSFMEGKP